MTGLSLWALVAGVTLFAGTTQTIAGFGFALLAVPTLSLVLPPVEAVAICAVLGVTNAALVASNAFRDVPWKLVVLLLAGSVAGMPLGLRILLGISPDALRILVGVVTALMAATIALGLRWQPRRRMTLAAGFISGILSTSCGINGPPIVLHLQASGLTTARFRSALSSFFLLNGVFSLGAFALSGVLDARALERAGAALPLLLAGNWLGHRLVAHLDAAAFRRFVLLLLGLTSTAVAVHALVGLRGG